MSRDLLVGVLQLRRTCVISASAERISLSINIYHKPQIQYQQNRNTVFNPHPHRKIKMPLKPIGLQDKYLSMMLAGTKIWEGRLNNAYYGSIQIGDCITFVSPTRKLDAIINEKREFRTFREMLQDNTVEAFLPGDGKDLDAAVEVYRSFPGYRDDEGKFGAVAFKIRVLVDSETQIQENSS